jgi:choline/glycine/proline betaine transport protein
MIKNNLVALIVAPLIVAFMCFSIFYSETTLLYLSGLKYLISENFGWLYVLVSSAMVVVAFYLALSKYGSIRLGPNHVLPEFSFISWLSMLFSAGLAVGLVFWGVAEPVFHFLNPLELAPKSPEAARDALNITIFHLGFHVWAIYALTALIIAYFAYRYDKPLSFRTLLYPFMGDRVIKGFSGDIIDSVAVIATIFGISTSLGFGAMQMSSGLNHVFGVENSVTTSMILIFSLTTISTISAVTGVKRGVKILSEVNFYISIALVVFFLIFGSTIFMFNNFIQSIGDYASTFLSRSLWLDATQNRGWVNDWSIFYWAWTFSWAPFVGIFIARISYGRTIKEFVLGAILMPTFVALTWVVVFGGAALDFELNQGITAISQAVENDISTAIFHMLDYMPMTTLVSIVFLILIAIYFVTSCDSGALVISALVSKKYAHSPALWKAISGFSIGAVSVILINFGGLEAIKMVSIIAALPFLIFLSLGCIGLIKFMKKEEKGFVEK